LGWEKVVFCEGSLSWALFGLRNHPQYPHKSLEKITKRKSQPRLPKKSQVFQEDLKILSSCKGAAPWDKSNIDSTSGWLEEACKLLEVGFGYVTDMEAVKLFRRRKQKIKL
jgi:hypothetical protein